MMFYLDMHPNLHVDIGGACLSPVTEQNVLSKNGTRRQAIIFVFLYLQYPPLALALAKPGGLLRARYEYRALNK